MTPYMRFRLAASQEFRVVIRVYAAAERDTDAFDHSTAYGNERSFAAHVFVEVDQDGTVGSC